MVGDHYFVRVALLRINDQRVIDQGGLALVKDLPYLEYLVFQDVTLRKEDIEQLNR